MFIIIRDPEKADSLLKTTTTLMFCFFSFSVARDLTISMVWFRKAANRIYPTVIVDD